MWHCRLGHISEKRMKKLREDGLLSSFDFESYETCEACLLGKMTFTSFTGFPERASDLLEPIHTDVCGPMSLTARGGFQYFITFIGDLSRYGYVYLISISLKLLKSSKNFRMKLKISVARRLKLYDLIVEANI